MILIIVNIATWPTNLPSTRHNRIKQFIFVFLVRVVVVDICMAFYASDLTVLEFIPRTHLDTSTGLLA